jgi:hypothetical protein
MAYRRVFLSLYFKDFLNFNLLDINIGAGAGTVAFGASSSMYWQELEPEQ